MAFSSLNTFSASTGLGISTKKSTSTSTYISGFNFIIYDGYFADNFSYTYPTSNTGSATSISTTTQISSIFTGTNGKIALNGDESYTVVWTGYFKVTVSDTYTFSLESDDGSYLWIDQTTYTMANATINNGGLHGMTIKTGTKYLTAGIYYPIRIMFGEQGGGDNIVFLWYRSGNTTTITDGTNYFYH